MKLTTRKLASQVLTTAEESSAELLQLLRQRWWILPDEEIRKPNGAQREPEWTTLKAMLRQKEFPPTAKTARIQWHINPRRPRLTRWPRDLRKLSPEALDPKPMGLLDLDMVKRTELRKLRLNELGELAPDELASLGPSLALKELPSLGTGLRLLELLGQPSGRLLTTNCEVADKTDRHWRAVLAIWSVINTSTRDGTCSLCEREWAGLTEHHLQPRQYVAKQDMTEDERTTALESTAWLCWPCHAAIHYNINNWDLGAHYNTPEKLKEHPRNADWLAWAKKQTVEELSRMSDLRRYAPILIALSLIVSVYHFGYALVNLR